MKLKEFRAKRIYIAGPMTGIRDYNFPAFNAAAKMLRSYGWHVENPAETGLVDSADWVDYMHHDISLLVTCSTIFLLPGWELSTGAVLERHIAGVLRMTIIYADDHKEKLPQ